MERKFVSCSSQVEVVYKDDAVLIQSCGENGTKRVLSISKKSGEVSFVTNSDISNGKKYQGLLGIVKLLAGSYMVLISETKEVSTFLNNKIYQPTKVEVLAVDTKRSSELTDTEKDDETKYIDLIYTIFKENYFYFSYTFDLTTNLQTLFTRKEDETSYDENFWWNKSLSRELIQLKANEFLLPMIRGFLEFKKASSDSKSFVFGLISRQSWKRTGTRFNIRGMDKNGNVANFCETEQILLYDENLVVLNQIRGSIPVHWTQKVNLKYTPKVEIKKNSSNAFKVHMDGLLQKHSNVLCVNLVNQTGSEKRLADEYKELCTTYSSPSLKYIHFDFHHECKGMKFENINKLVQQVDSNLQQYGYFSYDLKQKKAISLQNGTIRTNCLDNLDRTNVTQSTFGKYFLLKQFEDFGLTKKGEKDFESEFSFIFKNVWADNADAISSIYSGTGALKNDFTRTGKRSLYGLWSDFSNSVIRYYLNNFSDGKRQDSINLLLGKYQVVNNQPSPFKEKGLFYPLLKYVFFTGAFMGIVNLLMIFSGKE